MLDKLSKMGRLKRKPKNFLKLYKNMNIIKDINCVNVKPNILLKSNGGKHSPFKLKKENENEKVKSTLNTTHQLNYFSSPQINLVEHESIRNANLGENFLELRKKGNSANILEIESGHHSIKRKAVEIKNKIINPSFMKTNRQWIQNFTKNKKENGLSEIKPANSTSKLEVETIEESNIKKYKITSELIEIENPSEEIISVNLLTGVNNFYNWCQKQMDIATEDLLCLKKLKDNAEEKFLSLKENKQY